MPYANIMANWATCKSLSELGGTRMCSVCNKEFGSKQSLAMHKFKAHGIKSFERRYAAGTQCSVCLLEFWSRERLINHIKKCKVCNENLLMKPPWINDEEADVLDAAEADSLGKLKAQGLRRHAATKPCVQALGPLLPVVINPECSSRHHPLGKGYNKRV